MTRIDTLLLVLAVVCNLLGCVVNALMAWRHHKRIAAASAQLRRWAPSVGLVAVLSKPESGAPAWLQAECTRVLPRGDLEIEVLVEAVPRRVH